MTFERPERHVDAELDRKTLPTAADRVLVVDDHESRRVAAEEILAPLGVEILTAASGRDALRLALRHDLTLIVLDVQMPEIDGFEVAELLRSYAGTRNVPILLLTAHRTETERALRGYALHSVDCVERPVVPDVLRGKVKVFLDMERNSRAFALVEEVDAARARAVEELRHREQAEAALRDNMERLRLALEISHLFAWEWPRDEENWITDGRGRSVFGLAPEDYDGTFTAFLERVHAGDRARLASAIERVRTRVEALTEEFRFVSKHGSVHWLVTRARALPGADGRPARVVGVMQDHSETRRAQAEVELHRNELAARLRELGCIHAVSSFVERTDLALPDLLTEVGNLLRGAWRRSSDVGVMFRYGSTVKRTPGFLPADRSIRAPIFESGRETGSIEVHWTGETVGTHDPFTQADQRLVGSIAARVGDFLVRRRAEQDLRLAATVFETAAELILVTDAEGHITATNAALLETTGFDDRDLLGRSPDVLLPKRHARELLRDVAAAVEAGKYWTGEVWVRRHDGNVFPCSLSISGVRDTDRNVRQWVAVGRDVSEEHQAREMIWRQANYDGLTGLPNRALFLDRLESALAAARRSGARVGLMFLDLDRFKWINDSLGHQAGDRVLVEVARRVRSILRDSDTLARLGGDEFTAILPDLARAESAATVAAKVLRSLREDPVRIEGAEPPTSFSIGLTVYPDDARDSATLLQNADVAMYAAKEEGGSGFRFFTRRMTVRSRERLEIETRLRRALERDELSIHYQPIVDIATGSVCGAEALLRWSSDALGPVEPSRFIPLAEETGQIVPIGRWVLDRACAQAREWTDRYARPIAISVNVSSRQCRDGGFGDEVASALARHRLPAEALTLEITESLILEDVRPVSSLLNRLRDTGVQLSVDDFGTGYSSLGYLQRFPISSLKIDRSFVKDVTSTERKPALVSAIIAMALGLDLTIVGEGVESDDQLAFLKARGCHFAQGFYLGRPRPADIFAREFLEPASRATTAVPPNAAVRTERLPRTITH